MFCRQAYGYFETTSKNPHACAEKPLLRQTKSQNPHACAEKRTKRNCFVNRHVGCKSSVLTGMWVSKLGEYVLSTGMWVFDPASKNPHTCGEKMLLFITDRILKPTCLCNIMSSEDGTSTGTWVKSLEDCFVDKNVGLKTWRICFVDRHLGFKSSVDCSVDRHVDFKTWRVYFVDRHVGFLTRPQTTYTPVQKNGLRRLFCRQACGFLELGGLFGRQACGLEELGGGFLSTRRWV